MEPSPYTDSRVRPRFINRWLSTLLSYIILPSDSSASNRLSLLNGTGRSPS